MILVTGAAGKTGRAVVKALAMKGARVRALVRNPDHAGGTGDQDHWRIIAACRVRLSARTGGPD